MSSRQEKAAARKASQERIAQAQAETRTIVAANCCPYCGRPVRRNLALTGWYQCEQYGSEGFRKDASSPPCGWQGFTH